MKTKIVPIFLLLLTLQTHAQTFTEVSQSIGIEVLHEGKQHLGGGAAFFDYDQDGWLDIYATTGSNGVDHLYHNLGKSETSDEVRFEEVGIVAGLGITEQFRTMGVITGDLNQDGFTDLFISTWEDETTLHSRQTNLRGSRNLCFLNQGDGTFKEVGEQIGFTQVTFTMAASFGDYNLDGRLDLYLGNYLHTPKWTAEESFQNTGHPNLLYLNQGTDSNGLPSFVEVGESLGVNHTGCALACTFTDFDQDNDLDLLIANDFGKEGASHVLYRNNYPNNSFTDVSNLTRINTDNYGMGIAIGDYNNDGNLDYHLSNMGKNPLFASTTANQNFQDFGSLLENSTNEKGNLPSLGGGKGEVQGESEVSWGTVFFDFNHDTHLDLFVANGYIPAIELKNKNPYEIPNRLYQNQGTGFNSGEGFVEVAAAMGLDNKDIARGAAVGDYDRDGDLDILVANIANHLEFKKQSPSIAQDHFLLYRNDAAEGNWLKVSLEGTQSNRDGYGAKVRLTVDGQTFVREIDGGSSHLSHSSTIAHFGLADHTSIDKIEVIWPGGKIQEVLPKEGTLFDGKANQHIHIVEANKNTPLNSTAATYFQVNAFPNPFSASITLQYQLPKSSEVSIAIYNVAGALVADLLPKEVQSAGQHQLQWDGKNDKGQNLPFGTYFCKLQIGEELVTQKIVHLSAK